jgi:hypothetical protein
VHAHGAQAGNRTETELGIDDHGAGGGVELADQRAGQRRLAAQLLHGRRDLGRGRSGRHPAVLDRQAEDEGVGELPGVALDVDRLHREAAALIEQGNVAGEGAAGRQRVARPGDEGDARLRPVGDEALAERRAEGVERRLAAVGEHSSAAAERGGEEIASLVPEGHRGERFAERRLPPRERRDERRREERLARRRAHEERPAGDERGEHALHGEPRHVGGEHDAVDARFAARRMPRGERLGGVVPGASDHDFERLGEALGRQPGGGDERREELAALVALGIEQRFDRRQPDLDAPLERHAGERRGAARGEPCGDGGQTLGVPERRAIGPAADRGAGRGRLHSRDGPVA